MALLLDVTHPSQAAETITAATAAAFYAAANLATPGDTFEFEFTPTAASTSYVGGNYHCLLADASQTGGIWLVDATLHFFRTGDDADSLAQPLVWTAGQAVRIRAQNIAGTRSVTVTQATLGNGTFTPSNNGPWFSAAQNLGVGSVPGLGSVYYFAGAISDVTDGVSGSSAAISASAPAPTATTAARAASTSAISASMPAPTMTSAATGAATAISASASAPTMTSAAVASSTSAISASASAPTMTSAASGPVTSLWGSIGASAIGQRADQTGPATGTLSTAFVTRVPSATVAVNDRLVFNGRRWHVNTGGTLSAGAGPSGATGLQADGSAQVVPVEGDTELTMTTQAANSVMLAWVMRENSASDTSAPTDNKGNTYALRGTRHTYTGFTSATSALYVALNAVGGAGHVVSATWPVKSGTGAEMTILAVEVPTGRSTSFIQADGFVELAASGGGTLSAPSVTTTGPAMIVTACLGTDGVVTPIGNAHTGTPVVPYLMCVDADGRRSVHANGYIQGQLAYFFASGPGTYTPVWSTTAGAHLYTVAIQEVAGSSGTISTSASAPTSSSAAVTTAAAAIAASASAPTAATTARAASTSAIAASASAPTAAVSATAASTSAISASAPSPTATVTATAASTSAIAASASAPTAVTATTAASTSAITASASAPTAATTAVTTVTGGATLSSAVGAPLVVSAAGSPGTASVTAVAGAPLVISAASSPGIASITATMGTPLVVSATASAARASLSATVGAPLMSSAASAPGSLSVFWAAVARRCPEAALLLPAELTMIELVLDAQVPSGAPELARIYLARHLASMGASGSRGTLGTVTSETLGPSSTTYGTQGVALSSTWALTAWGLLYLACVGTPGPELI